MLDFGQVVEQRLPHLRVPPPERTGTLVRLVGLTLETRGIMAPVGACCEVVGQHGHRIEAEVVGFNDKTLFLMPSPIRWGWARGTWCAFCTVPLRWPWAPHCWAV